MGTGYKFLAISIVALFCATGYVAVMSDQSDAAKDIYVTHFELSEEDGPEQTVWWEGSVQGAVPSLEALETSMKECLGSKGTVIFNDGTPDMLNLISSVTYDGTTYAPSGKLADGDLWGFTIYCFTSKGWVQMTDAKQDSYVAIVYNHIYNQSQYDKLSDDEKSHLIKVNLQDGIGYAQDADEKIPEKIKSFLITVGVIILIVILAAIALIFYAIHKRKGKTAL